MDLIYKQSKKRKYAITDLICNLRKRGKPEPSISR